MKAAFTLLFSLLSTLSFTQISPFIHVDQFGYLNQAEKVAVISNPLSGFNSNLSYTAPGTLQVRENGSNAVVLSGPLLYQGSGPTANSTGDDCWWFDFSALTTSGEYYIYDSISGESSPVFLIDPNPYLEVLKQAGRMFFYNRCNMAKSQPFADANWTDTNNFLNPLQDANCRLISDPNNANLEKDLSGGWFDAGDYNKYVTYTYTTLHDLLAAYETNPDAFEDNWNLPESGNGIPDLIDEIKWELDWLLKMVNPDGSTHIKVGSQNYSQNVSYPPSNNSDPRFYGPTCTSASATVASVFAHASIVFRDFPSLQAYADQLEQNAQKTFDYVVPFVNSNSLELNCDDGSIVSGDADQDAAEQLDRMISAGIYLYEANGCASCHQFVIDYYGATRTISNVYWDTYARPLEDAFLRYVQLPTADTLAKILISSSANSNVNNNWEDLWGFFPFDPYRAYIPFYSYHWGSNQAKAQVANANLSMAKYNVANDSLNLLRKAAEQLHYFHGVNPLGMVYLSNMYAYGGDRCANQIYHTWFADGSPYDDALSSPNGPAPGYVVGGPNANYSNSNFNPPFGQPIQKSYLDFNSTAGESWEITEPAIYYQAAYLRLLSYFTLSSTSISRESPQPEISVSIFPNPARDYIAWYGSPEKLDVSVTDIQGRSLHFRSSVPQGQEIVLPALASGLYLIKLYSPQTGSTVIKKLFLRP